MTGCGQNSETTTRDEARERNRARWPDLAEFIDVYRAAGFDDVRVVEISWPDVAQNGDTC